MRRIQLTIYTKDHGKHVSDIFDVPDDFFMSIPHKDGPIRTDIVENPQKQLFPDILVFPFGGSGRHTVYIPREVLETSIIVVSPKD